MAKNVTKTKITAKTLIKHLSAKERDKHGKQIVRDETLPGFSLVVNQAAVGSWWVQFRPKGKQPDGSRWPYRSIRVGSTSTHGVEAARDEGRLIKAAAIQGKDPHAEQIAAREQQAAQRLSQKTLADALVRYLKFVDKRFKAGDISAKYQASEKLYASKAAEAITRERLEETGSDVVLLESIEGVEAIRAFKLTAVSQHAKKHMEGACARLFSHCPRGWLGVNPIKMLERTEKVKKGKSRTDHPTLHAMAKLWIAAAQEPPVIRDMTRMMLLLPARQGNLIHMNWDDIDWRHKVWQIPAPVTKNLESLTLQLSPAVIELLKIRKFPTKGQGLVFPTSKGTAYSGFSALKARLSKAAKLKSVNWRFHDFRRSFVTELANAGFDEVVLDLILNHAASQTRSGVLGVYQQATHMEARKEALHAWADLLLVAVSKIEAKQVEKKSA